MEQLFITIGELIATEIDEVEEVKYLDKEMGNILVILLKSGKQAILSLIETEI